jgi:hypothetical protein
VIARELRPPKPELKSQVCWSYDNSNIEPTNVELVSTPETSSSLFFEDELALFDASEVALYRTKSHNAGLFKASREPFGLVVGHHNFCVPSSCSVSIFQPDFESFDQRRVWVDGISL